jgi:serine/threonine protein phosphatase PrpC
VNGKYVFDIVAHEDDPNEAVKLLVRTATSSLKCHDNVSVIAVFT